MRNLTQPTIVDIGTVEVRGQDYYVQRLRYGTHHSVHIFRKGELHRHGLVFQTEADYEQWKAQLGQQRGLWDTVPHQRYLGTLFFSPSGLSTNFKLRK